MSLFDRIKRLFTRQTEPPPSDDSAPGWEAIDSVLKPLYGEQEPQHWGTIIKWMLGGPDPLDGVSAYRADGPRAHWHYVSYGMTDLYAKDSPDPAISGWGFEFTFRLARRDDEQTAPVWPVNLLQNLGRYVFNSGSMFGHGHYINCNGPIAADTQSPLVALLFMRDPQLLPIDTPHGRVEFLQAIGLTLDEYDACRAWNSESFAEILRSLNPLLVTDLDRTSVLHDEALSHKVFEGIARDGSSSDAMHVDALSWRRDDGQWVIEMTALGFGSLAIYLRGRLGHGRDFTMIGREQAVRMSSGTTTSVHAGDDELTIVVDGEALSALIAFAQPRAGNYDIPGLPVRFEVSPSVLRDGDGKVEREIG